MAGQLRARQALADFGAKLERRPPQLAARGSSKKVSRFCYEVHKYREVFLCSES